MLLLLITGGCTKKEEVHKVGILMPSMTELRWAQDSDSLMRQLQRKGYQVEIKNAEDDIDEQIKQINTMINSGYNILVISAIDGTKLTDVLQKVAEKKITVIAYDRLIMDTPNVHYYVTFDNFEIGRMQGEHLEMALDLKNNTGPFNLEIFSGSPADNNSLFYYDGAMSVLRPYIDKGQLIVRSGQVEIAATAIAQWSENIAKERMTELLNAYYKDGELHAVLSPNDGLAIGIIKALREFGFGGTGYPFPLLTGQDSEIENVKAILNGEQTMTVFVDTRTLADRTFQIIDAILLNNTPEINDSRTYHNNVKIVPTYMCRPVSVTKDNYKNVLIDSGYYNMSDFNDDK